MNDTEATKLEIKGLELLLTRLEPVRTQLMKKAASEKSKRAKRMAFLSQYESEDDLMEAWGNAYISREEYDRLRDKMARDQALVDNTLTAADIALAHLSRVIGRLHRDKSSLEYGLLPLEDQQRIDRMHEQLQKRATGRKAKAV
ncbi:hypothetical protein LJC32_04620 [Oscillospiraceae bacterium OttesenSCG-928-F05]|nr:hypothetical protein [Oscillospiraceae bacterium OttesenSCG-928-F05]